MYPKDFRKLIVYLLFFWFVIDSIVLLNVTQTDQRKELCATLETATNNKFPGSNGTIAYGVLFEQCKITSIKLENSSWKPMIQLLSMVQFLPMVQLLLSMCDMFLFLRTMSLNRFRLASMCWSALFNVTVVADRVLVVVHVL